MSIGLLGYGVYIPRYRINKVEYVKAWGRFAAAGIEEKAVPGFDEDSVTMAVEASMNALNHAKVDASKLNAIYFASTSSPYAEKLVSSTIAMALGAPPRVSVADFTSSTMAGTSALLMSLDFVASGRGHFALVATSDCPYADPSDFFEHPLGAGAAAFVVGGGTPIATIEASGCTTIEALGERFRKKGEKFIETLGIPAYTQAVIMKTVTSSVKALLDNTGRKPSDFNFVVLPQFDGRLPSRIARKNGFEETQFIPSMVVSQIGDAGAASPLIGLAKVLDEAKPGHKVLVTSYGAGAGSDAVSINVNKEIMIIFTI
jgi:hydroxymethylglutaryl-CoA synthase